MQQKVLKRRIKDQLLAEGVINNKILWLISIELISLGCFRKFISYIACYKNQFSYILLNIKQN